MNFSLVAGTAMLCVTGIASAQSNVSISGQMDAGIRHIDGTNEMRNSNSVRNSITLSGTEDLGSDTSVFFHLHSRFNMDDGTESGANAVVGNTTATTRTSYTSSVDAKSQFWREMWLGVRHKPIGDLRLGRMNLPLEALSGFYDAFDTSTIASVHVLGLAAQRRTNDTIYFKSTKFGGLEAHIAIAAKDTGGSQGSIQTPGATGQPMIVSNSVGPKGLGIRYDAGSLSAALTHDINGANLKTFGAFAYYDFGIVKAHAQYEKGDLAPNNTNQIKRWSISASIPVFENGCTKSPGCGSKLKLGYQKSDRTDRAGSSDKFGFGIDYAVSRRTVFYADVGKLGGDNTELGSAATLNKKTRFDVGFWHRF